MPARAPLLLLALLGACAPPGVIDSAEPASSHLLGPGARAVVDQDGLWLEDGQDGVGLSTVAWGREDALLEQPASSPREGGCWLQPPGRLREAGCVPAIERPLQGGLERWRRAGDGAQQGWTLTAPPEGGGPLVVDVLVTGAEPALDGEQVRLTLPSGRRWSYAGLLAWDDAGKALPAWMTVEDDLIRVWVDDSDATWPVHIDPVLSTFTTTLIRVSTDFGIGLALGGDVNNDGYADVLVGARFGTGLYGEAFSYHGSSSGVSTTVRRSYSSSDYYGKFGEYVENRGDVNGDGYDDAVISTFYEEKFTVYHGSSSGLASSATTTVTGVYGLGRGLATADWNNDGYDDVVAGAQEPGAYFYQGSSSGLSSTLVYEVSTSVAPSVSTAGDVNNNGYEDIVYGDESANQVYVAMGGSSFPASTTTLSRSGSYALGYAVTGGGDFNGDGYDDVASGDPEYSSGTGRVVVFYGSSSGVSSSSYSTISSPATGAGFGSSLQWLGDINGDGYDDLAVGDDYDHNYVYIYHGSASGIDTDVVNTLTDGGANFGYSMSAGGDVNGDGLDDVIIGNFASYTAYIYHGCQDADGDGECEDLDCDDEDASVNSSATEVCDGVDNDCDGDTDDDDSSVSSATMTTYYRDADTDGYGLSTSTRSACEAPSGYVSNDDDCNDSSSSINPGATETTGDGTDSNCDNRETCYADADNDGYRTSSTVSSTDTDCSDSGEALSTEPDDDCNDASSSINPSATETTGDGVDSDCDDAETCYADADNDGYRTTSTVSSSDSDCSDSGEALSSETSGDCDDADAAINPSATEVCDGADNDCDSLTDLADPSNDDSTAATYYDDDDSDGYGDASDATLSCDRPTGYVANDDDCDDGSSSINPGATETTGDGMDSDCDDAETCYADADNDGYRTTSTVSSSDSDCSDSGEALSSEPGDDCDDSSSSINPGATETTGDGLDSDCDDVETCYADADNDGYRTTSTVSSSDADCTDSGEALSSETSGDCDDDDSTINPSATEVCDGTDNDCDSLTDGADSDVDSSTTTTYYGDDDGDGYGESDDTTLSCDLPAGYAALDGDCDDETASTYPGATDEIADGTDSDCDGLETCYEDADDDGYRTDTTVTASDGDCDDSGEALSTDEGDDCDDADDTIYPGAPDPAYDGIDQDCGGDDTNDQDGDGHEAEAAGGDDCDDADATIYAGADETWYDGVDSDCGGDDDYDADADGQTVDTYGGDDCDDTDPTIYSGNEDAWYDGVDSDCGGNSDYDADADGHDLDTYGGDDCDDADATTYAGAPELYDGKDNDCDGKDELYDGDGDGLTDLVEGEIGTDPTDMDTDGDALGDGDEVDGGTDPLLADTDGGGVDDGAELARGSDALDPADDDLPQTYLKGSGCACESGPATPLSASWLLALAPLALLRRRRPEVL